MITNDDENPAPDIFGVLADRVDGEPPAILGLTTSELMLVTVATGLFLLPLFLFISVVLGLGTIALSLTGFMFLGGMYLGVLIFRRLKRGRPAGYYQVQFSVLTQRVLGGRGFMLRTGYWSIGRSLENQRTETR